MAKLVGNRYATALIESGIDLNMVGQFKEELEYIESVFQNEDKAFQLFIHPRITKDEKKEFISSVFKKQISEEMNNFLYILIDKKRERNFFEIVEEYEKLYNEHENIVKVLAITATKMDEKALGKLKVNLETKLNKKVEISNRIDNSVLGGVLLKVGDKIIDGTIVGQLETMEKAIKGVSL